MMRIIFVLALGVLVLFDAQAQSLCPAIKLGHSSEGAWQIPESAFTKQKAEEELRKLERLLGPSGISVDSVVWQTSFVYIEGWYLKRQALEAKNGEGPPNAIADFCDFMKKHAYVQH